MSGVGRSTIVFSLLVVLGAGIAVWAWTARRDAVPPSSLELSPVVPSLDRPRTPNEPETTDSPIAFTNVADESGLDFIYYGNPTPKHYMTEVNGGGTCLDDFDSDGRLDVFLVNGSDFDRPAEDAGASNALFRRTGSWRYRNITSSARLTAFGFGMGSAAGDINGDGFVDLFVCYYGENRMWINQGDGTFLEVGAKAGIDDNRWAASAAFGDLDADGLLDLYVCNYVEWSPDEPPCFSPHEPKPVHIACGPMQRPGQSDLLYRNVGDGRFEDVSESTGIATGERSKGLAVAIADLDEDRRLDVYIANDTTENLLFNNLGEMQFEEVALLRGVAVGEDGIPQAGMGIALADFTGNRHIDMFVTNFAADVNDFYENLGAGQFRARNREMGLDTTSRPLLGFGTLGRDFDLDQWPDLVVSNGHVWDLTSLGLGHQYEMPPQLFRNHAGRRFEDVSAESGPYFRDKWLGRSVAAGDLDDDGDSDLIITHLARPVAALRNDSRRAGGSMRLKLVGTRTSRQPLGARVEYDLQGKTFVTHIPAGGSFQSTSDPRILLATADATQIDQLRAYWPNGETDAWNNLPVLQDVILVQGRDGVLKVGKKLEVVRRGSPD